MRYQVDAQLRILVAHHAPCNARGHLYYDPWSVDRTARDCFGGTFVWAPISPVCRAAFRKAGVSLPLLKDDWFNLFFIDDWGSERQGPLSDRPVIGRHSRADALKWPPSRAEVLRVYPDDSSVRVRFLGAGKALKRVVGPFPNNWTTFAFNEMDAKEFLQTIDFFVYYHHPSLVEGFGRCPAEAAASGAVVILPPYFQATFADAAVYREPEQAIATVLEYFEDRDAYRAQSRRGRATIDRLFGPNPYLQFVRTLLDATADHQAFSTCVTQTPKEELNTALVPFRRMQLKALTLAKSWKRGVKNIPHYLASAILGTSDSP
jgi:hypothetical protein